MEFIPVIFSKHYASSAEFVVFVLTDVTVTQLHTVLHILSNVPTLCVATLSQLLIISFEKINTQWKDIVHDEIYDVWNILTIDSIYFNF